MSDTPVFDKAKLDLLLAKYPDRAEDLQYAYDTHQGAVKLLSGLTYATEPEAVELAEDDAPKWFTIGRRKWAYNVAIAILVILVGVQTGAAITFESWANLTAALLNLGGIGAVSLARANVR